VNDISSVECGTKSCCRGGGTKSFGLSLTLPVVSHLQSIQTLVL
jgi:hypothetical protein